MKTIITFIAAGIITLVGYILNETYATPKKPANYPSDLGVTIDTNYIYQAELMEGGGYEIIAQPKKGWKITRSEYQFNVDQKGYDIMDGEKQIGRLNYGDNPSLDSLIESDNL